jgi:hypothetical protein
MGHRLQCRQKMVKRLSSPGERGKNISTDVDN